MLKLDPKNTELVAQKQEVLNESIETTKEKLKQLEEIRHSADAAIASGAEINQENYRALQREIINTQNKLSDLKNENSKLTKFGDWAIKWGENLDKLSQKMDSLGSNLTSRITLPITAAATAGLTYDAQIEKYETAFKTFLGSAEKAGKAIKNIKDDAKRTPFDTTSLVKANQMLISTGVSADDARNDILALGEAVIATGGGNDELVRMSSNLQQIKNAGKATAMDIRQFAYAGIDVYGILADYTGKTTKEVKDMEVTYEDLTKALKKASSKGGKYFGAMANSSETLAGQVSALKSEVQEGIGDLTKSLMPTSKKVVARAREVIKQLDKLSDSEKENIVKIGLLVAASGPALKIASSAIGILGKVSTGIGTFSKAIALAHNGIGTATGSAATLAKVLQGLTSPIGLVTAGIAVLAGGIALGEVQYKKLTQASTDLAKQMENEKKSYLDRRNAIDESTDSELAQINSVERLKDELKTLVDENGKVKEGYESRVKFILKQLNEALGTEYKLNDNVVESYKKIQAEIDKTIEKKKAEIHLNAEEQKYKIAIEEETKAVEDLRKAQENLGTSYEEAKKKYDEWANADHSKMVADEFEKLLPKMENLKNYISAYEDAESRLKTSVEDQKQYISDYELFTQEKYNEIGKTVKSSTKDWCDTSLQDIKNTIQEQTNNLKSYKEISERTGAEIATKNQQQAEENLKNLAKELSSRVSTVEEMGNEEKEAWKILAENAYNVYDSVIKEIPQDTRKKIEDATGVLSSDTKMSKASTDLAEKVKSALNKAVDGYTWGNDLVKEQAQGMTNSKSKSLITSAASKVAGWISSYLHFSLPEKGPLSDFDESMPDMIDLMVKGINKGRPELDKALQSLTNQMNNKLINFDAYSGLNNKIIDSTKTVFTTPQINFYPQQMTEENMKACFNYINRRFGSAY